MEKVCPVVFRRVAGRTELLAFRHPLAGVQLIKGSIDADERPGDAARRELAEESGIVWDGELADLGRTRIGDPPILWYLFAVEMSGLPETWTHRTDDDGGQLFSFFWHPLASKPGDEWHEQFHEALAAIREAMLA